MFEATLEDEWQRQQQAELPEAAPALFGSAFVKALKQPLDGLRQLSGQETGEEPAARQSTDGKGWLAESAGSLAGNALLFIGATGLARQVPVVGRMAPVAAGAALGFLCPVDRQEGLLQRAGNALIGAGTVSILELTAAPLSRTGVAGGLGTRIAQVALTNSLAGAFNLQASSLLHRGHLASLTETGLSAATWAATGLAFQAAGSAASRLQADREAPLPASISARLPGSMTASAGGQFIEIPALEIGKAASPGNRLSVPRQSDLAKLYESAGGSLGKVEVLAAGAGGLEGKFGTAFAVSGDGRLATANHVVDRALDISVIDSRGGFHAARVIGQDAARDLAVLQLKNPSSFQAFKPLPLGDSMALQTAGANNNFFVALGHPNGWRDLFVSPGVLKVTHPSAVISRFSMHGQEGLSGGPIIADGKVLAVSIQAARSSDFEINGTPSSHLLRLLERTGKDFPGAPGDGQAGKTVATYKIADSRKASDNLEILFGKDFFRNRPADFFHARAKTVDLPQGNGLTTPLTLKMQYNPGLKEVSIEPIALNRQPLPESAVWPGTNVRIDGSLLKVRLDSDGQPLKMFSRNDPLSVLKSAFNFRGTDNYLAGLKPVKAGGLFQQLVDRLKSSGAAQPHMVPHA